MFDDALEQRIRALAIDDVGDAVTWGLRLPALPSIQLTLIFDTRPQHFKGMISTRSSEVQIDAWARTPATARAIREAIVAGLLAPALVGVVRFQRAMITRIGSGPKLQQGHESRLQPEIHRQSIDITFWHNG